MVKSLEMNTRQTMPTLTINIYFKSGILNNKGCPLSTSSVKYLTHQSIKIQESVMRK